MQYSNDELQESLKQITSLLSKLQAIDLKKLNKSQKTLIERRIFALEVSKELIEEKLKLLSN